MTGRTNPTPFELRALAARAEELAAEIDAVHAALGRAGDEPTRHAGFRLSEGAGHVRQAAQGLAEAAHDLEFIRKVRGRPHCGADWGCCPEHGATLTSTGGRCWCRAPGCGRSWDWDRLGLPCDEPPAFRVIDAHGGQVLLCSGHAIAAREQIVGGRVELLQDREEGS